MRYLGLIYSALLLLLLFACAGGDGSDTDADSADGDGKVSAADKEAVSGAKVYKMYCVACHGIDGSMAQNEARDLKVSELSIDERVAIITAGKGLMTPFGSILSEEQIRAVAQHTTTLKEN